MPSTSKNHSRPVLNSLWTCIRIISDRRFATPKLLHDAANAIMPQCIHEPAKGPPHLFLLRSSLFLLRLRTLLPLSYQTSITTRNAQCLVCVLGRLVVCDLAFLDHDLVADSECMMVMLDLVIVTVLTVLLHFLLGRLALLRRLRLAGEQDETSFVGFEALNVRGQRFFGQVLATGVDGDADCWSQLAWDAGFLS